MRLCELIKIHFSFPVFVTEQKYNTKKPVKNKKKTEEKRVETLTFTQLKTSVLHVGHAACARPLCTSQGSTQAGW